MSKVATTGTKRKDKKPRGRPAIWWKRIQTILADAGHLGLTDRAIAEAWMASEEGKATLPGTPETNELARHRVFLAVSRHILGARVSMRERGLVTAVYDNHGAPVRRKNNTESDITRRATVFTLGRDSRFLSQNRACPTCNQNVRRGGGVR